MKEGRELLNRIPSETQEKIIAQYGSLDNFYFEVWCTLREQYLAHIAGDKELYSQLQDKLYDFEDELEKFGVHGDDIVPVITTDFNDTIARKTAANYLSQAGLDKDDIKKFIDSYLGEEPQS